MHIVTSERTPEFLAHKIGNVQTNIRSFENTLLLFALTSEELVSAISFRPAIAQELEDEAKLSEAVAIVWSRAKAGLDAKAAMQAVNDLLLNCLPKK